MNLNKPAFWDLRKISLWSILLLPLTALYYLILETRRKMQKAEKFNIKIICVGNIYIGGTGKTPLTIKIASLLKNKFKLAVIKKKYADQKDEVSLLEKKCRVISNRSRKIAIEQAIEENYNMVILDDGFQDEEIKKDISIVCFNSAQSIGNGFILPSGPLRENLQRLKFADMVFINGDVNIELENKIKVHNKRCEIFYSYYHLLNLENYKNKRYFAFSGIGNNINFLNLLKKKKINIVDYKFFPDHYKYSDKEIYKLKNFALKNNLHLITTEKDYLRLSEHHKENINYTEIELIIKNEDELIRKIMSYESN
jgi:tetraacyldisaccharide 4'-kinase